jgi:16S rRNA (adenine1518-N6/adenine1519-N6)-dimethyltransferase
MSLIEETKVFLNQIHASTRKKLGQNFMISESELSFIADATNLKAGESILEIGPGLGFLTRALIRRRMKVLAVEKDRLYAKFLQDYFKNESFQILERDILEIDLRKDFHLTSPIQVIGNIPYNITGPILEWLISQRKLISQAILATQLEVGQRLTASPGTKAWGSLSLFLQVYADVSLIKKINRANFYPSPQVDSAVIEIRFLEKPRVKIRDEQKFFKLVRRAFQKRRKTLLNALVDENFENYSKPSLVQTLKKVSIDPMRRAETLTLEDWARLNTQLA